MHIEQVTKQINGWLKDILKDNYVGVYFHGSLRLGSFNPEKSDLDFIIVVKEKVDVKTKELIWDKMLDNLHIFPKKGFEFSVVLEEDCRNIKYPTPYELHGSRDWIERYRQDKSLVINDDKKTDPDLVSHFNVINVENDALDFGKPAKDVFAKVPREYVVASNYNDVLDCAENILNNPTYGVLNLCRFYALVKEGLTLSKYDGGEWAIGNLNTSYSDVIKCAMDDYLGNTDDFTYDESRLMGFVREMKMRIDEELNRAM
jgi:streptomycin 3"-adenylyltransferase